MSHNCKNLAVAAAVLCASISAFATTGTPINGSLQAQSITVRDSTSLKGLSVTTANVSAAGSKTKHITSVVYAVKAYPPNAPAIESVEICYSTPYSSTIGNCVQVAVGGSGTLTNFNTLTFGAGAEVWIRHKATGAPLYTQPATPDTLTINWAY